MDAIYLSTHILNKMFEIYSCIVLQLQSMWMLQSRRLFNVANPVCWAHLLLYCFVFGFVFVFRSLIFEKSAGALMLQLMHFRVGIISFRWIIYACTYICITTKRNSEQWNLNEFSKETNKSTFCDCNYSLFLNTKLSSKRHNFVLRKR